MEKKSLATNLTALGLVLIGYFGPSELEFLFSAGLFALSGALTNWLAIHMLFEKIPGLYGSGIIPNKFESFKTGIHDLIMNEFFSEDNIERFVSEQFKGGMDLSPLLEAVDYEKIYSKLLQSIEQSPLGAMLGMFGGPAALDGAKPMILEKIREALREMVEDPALADRVSHLLSDRLSQGEDMKKKIDAIVYGRLEELTPQMVKEIIQTMIRDHLGWLVIWGGVFGGLMGVVGSFFVSFD